MSSIVAILGMGKTGVSLAKYCRAAGAEVWGIDDKADVLKAQPELAAQVDAFYTKENLPDFSRVTRCFISPGVHPQHPAAVAAERAGLKLEGELEFAFTLAKGPVLGITGTNGKSTTTTLLGEILRAAGLNVGVGGNLGTPFIDLVTDPRNYGDFVVEISSYQLETVATFKPKVAALLNITDDHLDRYAGLKEYARAKGKIFAAQDSGDFAVYNEDDLRVLEVMEFVSAPKRVPFSITKKVRGAYAEGSGITWAPGGPAESHFNLERCKLKGLHNLENMACAIACAKSFGTPDAAIQEVLDRFVGLPHRIEWVAEIGGVNYYDDSKATNVGAVVMSLASFDEDVVLIMGGRDKGGKYTPLVPMLKHKAKAVVVIGEAKELIADSLHGACEIVRANTLDEAVRNAQRLAPKGGTVLLAPACSSFDMFKDYHDRGEQFKKAVLALR